MGKGIFLDRDGVINPNVFNPSTEEWESPHRPEDLELFPWSLESLKRLLGDDFHLFLVSNQPSYAKGKVSLEDVKAVHKKFHSILVKNEISFTEYYYCYHHPQGVVSGVSIRCNCRKPGILFLQEAQRNHSLDMGLSWMIGDRDSDIICGQKAGVRTILILNPEELTAKKAGKSSPDFEANSLAEAVDIILKA